jgi:CheY-like chemotaxis protein
MEGWLEILRRTPVAEDPLGKEAIDDMSACAARSAAISRRLLLYGGDHVTKAEPLELATFLRKLESTLVAVVGPGSQVAVHAAPCRMTHADPDELAHVLTNLAANARDAMQGRGRLQIVLREPTTEERSSLPSAGHALDVADTGTGISRDVLPHLFEPFVSTKGGRGTGLGLASVKKLVEGAGGRVRVKSSSVGTTFTLLIPDAPPLADAPAPPSSVKRLVSAVEPLDAPLVLFVEDDDRILRVFEQVLRHAGLRLDVAQSVDEALACLERRAPDLIWTDAVMPGRPTRELLSEVRRRWPSIPVVVCSGHVAEELLRRDIFAGEVEFVQKPYTASQVVERARRARAEGRPRSASVQRDTLASRS